jgi:hypothetical protein
MPRSHKLTRQILLHRISNIESHITKCREYLETGAHADWRGFRPLFTAKIKDGKKQPPHSDWVRNWLLPRHEKALARAEKMLRKFEISN